MKKSSIKELVVLGLGLGICLFSLSACGEPPLQGDIKAGQEKSAICGQCHGQDGISIVPIYPNLAGQKEQYMVLALKAYRSGERINMAMTPHARNLSDQDIADLAAYYADMGNANTDKETGAKTQSSDKKNQN